MIELKPLDWACIGLLAIVAGVMGVIASQLPPQERMWLILYLLK